MRIGLDLHGVIDTNIKFYSELTALLVKNGHEVHIITGKKGHLVQPELKEKGILYTHLFSITDYHVSIGTSISWDAEGNPHMDPYTWDRTKAQYCKENNIDLHLDDSDIYNYFFKTPYARVYGKDSDRTRKIKI